LKFVLILLHFLADFQPLDEEVKSKRLRRRLEKIEEK